MEIIIFTELNVPLENLPMTLKEIWIKTEIKPQIKVPFGCEIYNF